MQPLETDQTSLGHWSRKSGRKSELRPGGTWILADTYTLQMGEKDSRTNFHHGTHAENRPSYAENPKRGKDQVEAAHHTAATHGRSSEPMEMNQTQVVQLRRLPLTPSTHPGIGEGDLNSLEHW